MDNVVEFDEGGFWSSFEFFNWMSVIYTYTHNARRTVPYSKRVV